MDYGSAQLISALTIDHYAGSQLASVAATVYDSTVYGLSWSVVLSAVNKVSPGLNGELDAG